MQRRPPRSTRTDTLLPYTTLFRSPVDLQSQLISGPGRIWPLRNMKAVGQFSAADVEQFLKPINTFTGLMAAVTATPVSYFLVTLGATRSEERRVGNEGVSTCRSRWSPDHSKKNQIATAQRDTTIHVSNQTKNYSTP